ncbi:MAG: metallophosphoesterase [Planctomycetes bacterium]|nr:metallophosphoesterase [Planctomycetota bacterium]
MRGGRFLVVLAVLGGCRSDAGTNVALAPAVSNEAFTFAVIADPHIGEGHDVYGGQEDAITQRLRAAVADINLRTIQEPIAFVFIVGDLTDSAEAVEYAKAREILDGLAIPYYPLLGNHDVWTYDATREFPFPYGDELFEQTFADRLRGLTRPHSPAWNPEHEMWCFFQNFELRYRGIAFFGLDWVSRAHADIDYNSLNPKGAHPEADLHDFPGGTYRWLQERLEQIPAGTHRIVLLQHHAFRPPSLLPDWRYSFSGSEKTKLRELLNAEKDLGRIGGFLAGHFHRWNIVDAFDEWPGVTLWEIDACKDSGAVGLFRVDPDGSITRVVPE